MTNWRESVAKVERNVQKIIEGHVAGMLPEQCNKLMNYILERVQVGGMTGNTWNGFGVGAYKDGKLMYEVLSWEVVGKAPSKESLVWGEHFRKGAKRWDDSTQEEWFTAGAGDKKAFGQELASDFMDNHRPAFTKGFCFCVVSAVDYSEFLEFETGANLLQDQQSAIESMGAKVTEIMTGV